MKTLNPMHPSRLMRSVPPLLLQDPEAMKQIERLLEGGLPKPAAATQPPGPHPGAHLLPGVHPNVHFPIGGFLHAPYLPGVNPNAVLLPALNPNNHLVDLNAMNRIHMGRVYAHQQQQVHDQMVLQQQMAERQR